MTAPARHRPAALGRDCVAMRAEHLVATPPMYRGVTEHAFAGKADDEIPELVRHLEVARRTSDGGGSA